MPRDEPWGPAEDIFRDDLDRQKFLSTLGEKGIPEDTEAGRGQFASLMERRRGEESGADYERIRRDWVLGSEAFRPELLAAVVERVGPSHYGAQSQETGLHGRKLDTVRRTGRPGEGGAKKPCR